MLLVSIRTFYNMNYLTSDCKLISSLTHLDISAISLSLLGVLPPETFATYGITRIANLRALDFIFERLYTENVGMAMN